MKTLCFCVAGLMCLMLFHNAEQAELGQLQPVELVQVTTCSGSVRIRTDSGLMGEGRDLQEALMDLHSTAPGTVYLETADFLLVTPATVGYMEELRVLLRPAVELAQINCLADGQKAAEFLRAHSPGITLRQWDESTDLPILRTEGERYELERGM